jgi:D-glycero-D-manno-heptose 1,7-bisphosphate phosphatase
VSPAAETRAAVFLDRDGVIIENRADYVRRWADVACYPQAMRALARLHHWPGKVIVVTNQSVVGRGFITLHDAQVINRRLADEIAAAGGRIDAILMCPHAPEENCTCRKPQPGLLRQAARTFDIDLAQSIMIGDALTDIEAGRAAGVGTLALVRTGRGRQQLQLPALDNMAPFPVHDTLTDALQAFIWQ